MFLLLVADGSNHLNPCRTCKDGHGAGQTNGSPIQPIKTTLMSPSNIRAPKTIEPKGQRVDPPLRRSPDAAAASSSDDASRRRRRGRKNLSSRFLIRCATVCRRWWRLVAGAEAACLHTPPRHFGVVLADSRGHRLLLPCCGSSAPSATASSCSPYAARSTSVYGRWPVTPWQGRAR